MRKIITPHRRAGPQSVGRVFSILGSLAEAENGATLSELAVKVGAPKTSLVGLLAGLVYEGCLVRDDVARYSLGPKFISLAIRVIGKRKLVPLARPFLVDLMEKTGETAVLGTLAPDEDVAIYLDKVESTNSIRYAVDIGERRQLYSTAVGKVLLAHFAPAHLKAYLKTAKRKRFTPKTLTKAQDLEAELRRIRQNGFASSVNEQVIGASAVAAPIHALDGSVAAVIVVAGPSDRIIKKVNTDAALVVEAADECSRLLRGSDTEQ